jgi:uncharacterized protein (AIM24 family)
MMTAEAIMQFEIEGELAQVAHLTLDKGESCWASKGSLVSIDPGLGWTLKLPGGLGGSARRMLSGEGVSLTFLEASHDGQRATVAANQPGKIVAWDLGEGAVITTRGSFVAAFGPAVEIDVQVARRAGAALFGGAGLFLQQISGSGTALIHGAGDFVEHRLAKGQSILVSTGNLAAFAETVDYDIQGVAGCRRIAFGGEGLFMTRLSGPGLVLLQSLKRTSTAPHAKGA